MTPLDLGLLSFPILLFLIVLRMPIGLAMLVCGLGGMTLVTGSPLSALSKLKTEVYSTFASDSLAIIPLFLLMSHFATVSGMSKALFEAAESWLGHRRGGMAMAAIGACAGFGAICGSSLATAATMGRVALPELRRSGYSDSLSTGALAAGGTLGILIPPSIVLVIYAMLSEQNIARLFVAALIPGLLAALGYMVTIAIVVRLDPSAAGTGRRASMAERLSSLAATWPVILVFALVVGGIYGGLFTPNEAASVGALATALLAWAGSRLDLATLRQAILETATSTAMIFFIVLGAGFYNGFLALSQLPQEAAAFIVGTGLDPMLVLIGILLFYLVLGCFMDSLSMILLTIPIFLPMVQGLDFGLPPGEFALWFGILVLIVVEVGLITPPVGLNLFVISSLAEGTPITATFRGVLPFVVSDIVRTGLLVAFPAITLVAVRLLY